MSADKLRLTCTFCFGGVPLRTETSALPATAVDVKESGDGTKTYFVAFSSHRFKFLSPDLSEYDLEQEMGGKLNAILRVGCVRGLDEDAAVALGWAQIQLFERRQARDKNEWELIAGVTECDLVPGASHLEDSQPPIFIGK